MTAFGFGANKTYLVTEQPVGAIIDRSDAAVIRDASPF